MLVVLYDCCMDGAASGVTVLVCIGRRGLADTTLTAVCQVPLQRQVRTPSPAGSRSSPTDSCGSAADAAGGLATSTGGSASRVRRRCPCDAGTS